MIFLISGPTGSGKTDLAIEVSKTCIRPLINADPYQFYREIPILSNQPSLPTTIKGIATRSIFEPLTAGVFGRMMEADPEFPSSILIGTGLYVGAALYGLDAERIKGTPFQKGPKHSYRAVVLDLSREELYERLNTRVNSMIESGAVEESERIFRTLQDRQDTAPSAALKAIGLKTLLQYHAKEITLDRAVELWKRDTRRLAKRQWNWLRKFVAPSDQHLWVKREQVSEVVSFLVSD